MERPVLDAAVDRKGSLEEELVDLPTARPG